MNYTYTPGQVVFLILLAIPIACVSWTVTNEEIFRDMREHLQGVSKRTSKWCVRKACYLPTCHYCFSHWVTAGFLALTGYRFLLTDWRGYILAEFALVLVVNVYLTSYNILRVVLRKMRATADFEEARAREAKAKHPAPAKEGVVSVSFPSPHSRTEEAKVAQLVG